MLREAYEEACKVRIALLVVLSARDVTNVESDILIRKDAGPEGNSLALGNVGLIDVKEARVDGEAQKCSHSSHSPPPRKGAEPTRYSLLWLGRP